MSGMSWCYPIHLYARISCLVEQCVVAKSNGRATYQYLRILGHLDAICVFDSLERRCQLNLLLLGGLAGAYHDQIRFVASDGSEISARRACALCGNGLRALYVLCLRLMERSVAPRVATDGTASSSESIS